MERRLDGLTEVDVTGKHLPIGQGHAERLAVGVRVPRRLDEAAHDHSIDQESALVDQVEPSILRHAVLGQENLGRVLEGEAPDGSDREASDLGHRLKRTRQRATV